MFELSQLRCFVAAARELNFRRAAQLLHMTQPPLSRQIQLLEKSLNVLLFERTSRSVKLTAAGRSFFIEAQDLLKRAEMAALTARQTQAGQHGSLVLGFIPISAFGLLPPLLSTLQSHIPDVTLRLHEMMTIEQVEAIAAGRVDLGLIRMPRQKNRLTLQCVRRETFVLAVPARHPLAAHPAPTLDDLDDQAFIMYSPADGWYSYELIAPVFNYANVRPRYVQYLGQTHTILALVSAGVGCALVPASSQALGLPGVVFRRISFPIPLEAETYLAWQHDDSDNPLLDNVRKLILEILEHPMGQFPNA